jgi:hypothetical protein
MVDDLDGTSASDVSTVTFGLDGVEYEIDLSDSNATSLRKALDEFVQVGRRTGGRLRRGTPSAAKSATSGEAGQIREWAAENGYELAGRGRIPGNVIEAYREAAAAAKRPAKRGSSKKK